jgi:hypothetical protein
LGSEPLEIAEAGGSEAKPLLLTLIETIPQPMTKSKAAFLCRKHWENNGFIYRFTFKELRGEKKRWNLLTLLLRRWPNLQELTCF